MMIRRGKLALFIVVIIILITIYIYKLQVVLLDQIHPDFSHFNNVNGSSKLIVPNLVHFIQFDVKSINFVTLVCILSAWYNQRPSRVYLHTNVELEQGRYLGILRSVLGDSLEVHELKKPTHVYGQRLSSVQHASDVARIKVLSKYGGIYLDEDVYVVKNLNRFRHFECALGWPGGQHMGSQVILAHREARFLKLWMELYREYRPTMWYFNAGEAPTKNILAGQPYLVHRVTTEFGVENLSQELYHEQWSGWINRYTIHLLSNHHYLHNNITLDEHSYSSCNCTFATLVDLIRGNLEDDNIRLGTSSLNSPVVHDTEPSVETKFEREVKKFLDSDSPSLLKKYLNLQMLNDLKEAKTGIYGSTLEDVIRTGLSNPDSSIGIFAPDPEAYTVFRPLFHPIIVEYHDLVQFEAQPETTWGDLEQIGAFPGDQVISTRIRIARSIAGFPFNSKMAREDLLRLEQLVSKVLVSQFSGQYLPLAELTPEDKTRLRDEHLLFEDCDRFTIGGGGCKAWPAGRGIFLSSDRNLIVWVNEEDHLRIISLEQGGDLNSVYSRLVGAVTKLEESLEFVRDDELGYLTFCPTNIGTTLRASVHLRFSGLSASEVEAAASELGLQVRGTSGEHTEVAGGVFDLSNKRRLGITEFQAVSDMYNGVSALLRSDSQKKVP